MTQLEYLRQRERELEREQARQRLRDGRRRARQEIHTQALSLRMAERLHEAGSASDVTERTVCRWLASQGLGGGTSQAFVRRASGRLSAPTATGVADVAVSASPQSWATPTQASTESGPTHFHGANFGVARDLAPAWHYRNTEVAFAPAPMPGVYALQMSARSDADVDRARDADPRDVLARLGHGRPVPLALRAQLGPRLLALGIEVELSTVRIHDDTSAAALCAELGGEAFTIGTHIAFGANRYREDGAGAALLAHELTHVWQQARGVAPAGLDGSTTLEAEAQRVEVAVRAEAGSAQDLGVIQKADIHVASFQAPNLDTTPVEVGLGFTGPPEAIQRQEAEVVTAPETTLAPVEDTAATAVETEAPVALAGPAEAKILIAAAKALATPAWLAEHGVAAWLACDDKAFDVWTTPLWAQVGLASVERTKTATVWFNRAVIEALGVYLMGYVEDLQKLRWFNATQDRLDEYIANARPERAAMLAANKARYALLYDVLRKEIESSMVAGAATPVPEVAAPELLHGLLGIPKVATLPSGLHNFILQATARLAEALPAIIKVRAAELNKAGTDLPAALRIAATRVCLNNPEWFEPSNLEGFVQDVYALLPDPKVIGLEELRKNSLLVLGAGEVGAMTHIIWAEKPSPEAANPLEGDQDEEIQARDWKVNLGKWLGGGRDYNVGLFGIPTWHYYSKHIVPYTFMGFGAPKRNGLHREIASRLPAVEARIRAIAKSQGNTTAKWKFFGFRMQFEGGASEHPRGRAMDSSAKLNPHVKNADTVTLMNVLIGRTAPIGYGQLVNTEAQNIHFEEQFQDREDAALEIIDIQEDIESSRLVLSGYPTGQEEYRQLRIDLIAHIAKGQTRLSELQLEVGAPMVLLDKGHVAHATNALDALESIGKRLANAWRTLGGDSGDVDAIAAVVRPLIDRKVREQQSSVLAEKANRDSAKAGVEVARANAKSLERWSVLTTAEVRKRQANGEVLNDTARDLIKANHRNAYIAAQNMVSTRKAELEALGWRNTKRDHLAALEALSATLSTPAGRDRLLKQKAASVAPTSIVQLAKDGLTNIPRYMVKGFAECGWRWGGEWARTPDAMHFENEKKVTDAN